ncbi:MarR family winged helix-turn-helix transcriptional regulator [Natronoglycomyces albus]|uniref:MarR family transcriptional regulator n=1 Tax=Natronoglycomyces albus TaxID=2811108 RepID=A0A895XEK5_9ACTN|nr:MarR family transcriptional regulator [Natronoglycomyces albus]QSB04261.1 MarR family transcriptional regulator [Natronoglycomyces albus]
MEAQAQGQERTNYERTWLEPAAADVWAHFLTVTHQLEQKLERHLQANHGLSHTQYEILVRLADSPDGAIRMSDLAENLVTAKSAVTYQVGKMCKAGLIERFACPLDARATYVRLTSDGEQLLSKVAPCHLDLVKRLVFADLTCEEANQLTEILSRWQKKLKAEE